MAAGSPKTSEVRLPRDRVSAVYERGLERCRAGEWKDGLVDLAFLAEHGTRDDVPALCYSYLGFGLAHRRGQIDKGLRLCRYAVKREFFQPEGYVNLARTALLSERYKRVAAEAVLDGLEIDPRHPELLELQRQLGVRRPPVVGFLSRRNPINQILGWIRFQFRRRQRTAKAAS